MTIKSGIFTHLCRQNQLKSKSEQLYWQNYKPNNKSKEPHKIY